MKPINYEKKTTRGKLTPTLIAYIAGLFDGEGSIYISKVRNKRSGSWQHTLGVSCGVNFKGPSNLLSRFFCNYGKGYIYRIRGYKPHYQWMVAGRLALKFLKTVYPYLWIKREQAKLGIEFQEYKTGQAFETKGKILPIKVLKERNDYYWKMKELNSKHNGRVITAATNERRDTL